MKINLNDSVRVKLTEYGRKCLAQNQARLQLVFGKDLVMPGTRPDAEGWTEWQLWSLMQEFGQHLSLGSPVPFEACEILILQANA